MSNIVLLLSFPIFLMNHTPSYYTIFTYDLRYITVTQYLVCKLIQKCILCVYVYPYMISLLHHVPYSAVFVA